MDGASSVGMEFPSPAWASAFRTALNQNPSFREAGKAWEADILFLVRSADSDGPAAGIRLNLSHGECVAAEYSADAREVAAEFVFEGTSENWGRLLRRELEPVRPFIDGTFKVRGNLAKAVRFTRAAKELVETASGIPLGD